MIYGRATTKGDIRCAKTKYQFWVYVLSSRSHTLYIGMTNSLRKRVMEHRNQLPGTFTARYRITRLVYCEEFQYVNNAIAREKELKKWTRAQKIALIEAANPTWEGLMPDAPSPHSSTQIPFGNDKPEESQFLFCLSFPQGICVCTG